MIKRLRYNEIDFEKYKECIENSVQGNWYANKEVLDLNTDYWELLMINDYEYVLPVPKVKKYGFNIVAMPVFLQQLGIFGKKDRVEINELFLTELFNNYLILNYSFNSGNTFNTKLLNRKNYVIFSQKYDMLFQKKFSKGRKSVLKKIENLEIRKIIFDNEIQDFIDCHFKGLKNKNAVNHFVDFVQKQGEKLTIKGVYLDSRLITLGIFTHFRTETGLLALINDENYKEKNAPSFLINEVLKDKISHYSLDFMGGNKRGIEIFFKSFGATLTLFPTVVQTKTQLLKDIIKKQMRR